MAKRTLRLTVLDEDTIGYDFIGETRVPLSDINAEQTQNFNTVLEKLQPVCSRARLWVVYPYKDELFCINYGDHRVFSI